MNKTPVEFGSRQLKETYFGGELKSVDITVTEALNTHDLLDALEKTFNVCQNLILSGTCKGQFIIAMDIDEKKGNREVKRIHVTRTTTKEQIPPSKR